MATRSLIGMVKEDKSIQLIYCHWDGYPTYVGVQLALNYRDAETIQKLLNLGNRSTLSGAPTVESTYAELQNQEIKPWTVASFEEFQIADKAGADYVYIWDNDWVVFEADYDNNLKKIGTIDNIIVEYSKADSSI